MRSRWQAWRGSIALLLGAALLASACTGDGDSEPSGTGGSAGGPNAGGAAGEAGAEIAQGGSPAAGGEGGASGASQGELFAVPGASRYALVGEEVVLDGSASIGALSYEWYFGDGDGWDAPRSEAAAEVTYETPGRYQAVLTVYDAVGNQHAAGVTISVTHPSTYAGTYSRTLAPIPASSSVVAVSADADQLVVIERGPDDAFEVTRRIPTCDRPRTVTVWQGFIVTGCQAADQIGLYPLEPGAPVELTVPRGSAPFGVAAGGSSLFVALQGTGKLAEIRLAGDAPVLYQELDAIADARGVATLPDGRVAVTRWRSPGDRGEIALVDPASGDSGLVTLAFDPQIASDAEIGGVPSYLSEFAVSPTGREAMMPSLIANHTQGAFLSGRALTFETTVRAALSRVDLLGLSEDFPGRVQFDELGFAASVAFSSHGDFAYVAMPGNRSVSRVDLLTLVDAGVFLDAGFAPDGALVTADDGWLLVNASLSRELVVYRADASDPMPVQRLPLLESEPLDPVVLRGKQLFNDAADPRIARSGYVTCAHCHLDGDSDQRVWDFTDRGEGLRSTVSLLGRAGTGDGPIHWSANFDEIQDFEHDIRNAFGGTGLMADADFAVGTRSTTLGDTKAGVSADLDALAAYAASLVTEPKSPFRNADGSLTQAATNGKALFESAALGCTTCHSGPRLTDSQFIGPAQPLLHDVGTLAAGSGERLGGPLDGLDTPTLHGLWASAPYLHDGSAPDLVSVLRERNPGNLHGTTSILSDAELSDLVQYLLSLDGSAP